MPYKSLREMNGEIENATFMQESLRRKDNLPLTPEEESRIAFVKEMEEYHARNRRVDLSLYVG